MAAKIIRARQMRDRFVFVVHLDTTKVNLDASPDARWLLRREWPLKEGAQKAAYLAAIRDELQAAAAEQLARLQDEDGGGVALNSEGATF